MMTMTIFAEILSRRAPVVPRDLVVREGGREELPVNLEEQPAIPGVQLVDQVVLQEGLEAQRGDQEAMPE
jgi:hypothetical protein